MAKAINILLILALFVVAILFGVAFNSFLKVKISSAQPAAQEKSKPVDLSRYEKPLIMGDTGIAGFVQDPSLWFSDYSHHGFRFARLFRKDPPYYNLEEWERFKDDLRRHLNQLRKYGFNAVEMPGYIELVDFAEYGVYEKQPQYLERHRIFRQLFSEVISIAESYGIKVIFTTDMVVLSQPLVDYLKEKGIGLDVENPEFWKIYGAGLNELFTHFPKLYGLMIRIGEAGRIYSQQGWDYWSELLVKTKPSVKKMLSIFLQIAEKHNRKIIFRSWAVGIGEVGKMHTVPQAYLEVLEGIESKNLIVSTKYNRGDFWTNLPLNPTLFVGKEKRIVEFQTRREFEAFTIFPNYVAPHYQHAYRLFLEKNQNIMGAWIWSHSGGPLFQGPYMFYLKEGLWQWMDANLYATAKIVQNPNADMEKITREWIGFTFGRNPQVVKEIYDILIESHELTAALLSFLPFSQKQAYALGQEVPPVAFCYWNVVAGSSSILSNLYLLAKEDLEVFLQKEKENVQKAATFRRRFEAVKDKTILPEKTKDLAVQSFAYMENLGETLSAYRKFFLSYYHWLDTGDDRYSWQNNLVEFEAKVNEHRQKYFKNIYFPSYNFEEPGWLIDTVQKAKALRQVGFWVIFPLLSLLLLILAFVKEKSATTFMNNPKAIFLLFGFWIYALFVALIGTFWRGPAVVGLVAALSAGYLIIMYMFLRRYALSVLVILQPGLFLATLVALFLSYRGPQYFWFKFWTDPTMRFIYAFSFFIAIFGSPLYLHLRLQDKVRGLGGVLLLTTGLALLTVAAIFWGFGFEEVITQINKELVVLPYFLTLIHGIVSHLNIPPAIPQWLAYAGMVLLLLGALRLRWASGHLAKQGRSVTP
ncbi:MAG: hypothetical protein NZM25_11495 [Leptospiraceae bacterium]|nr:hypothetical protein [Leptospiraceae bacterium]MDW8307439.1 hypothetical protein [Leptospiraceae bacterium]